MGKGVVVVPTVRGIERAAASETTPRIPVQPNTIGAAFPGLLGAATLIKLRIMKVTRSVPKAQPILMIIKTMVISTP